MKKIGFEEYLKREILKLKKEIEQRQLQLAHLSKTIKELFNNEDKNKIIRLYHQNKKSNSFKKLSVPKDKELIEFYAKYIEATLKEELLKLNEQLNNLLILKSGFSKTTFYKPIILNSSIINTLLEFGNLYNIEPYDMLNEIILLAKLNSIIEQKNLSPIAHLLNGLSNLFSNNLTLKNENDIKAVEFILRKINYQIQTELTGKEKYDSKYLSSVTLSINDALTKPTPEDRVNYQKIIESSKKPVKKKLLNAESELSEYMISNKSLGNTFSKEVLDILDDGQLLLIEEAFKIIKKSKNKNQIKLLKRLINDVISSCRFINMNKDVLEEPADVNHEIECLELIVSAIKNKQQEEPLFYYLINEKTGNPIILEDIKGLPEEENETIYNILVNLDTLDTIEIAKKGRTKIYEVEKNGITILFATNQNNIIIIGIRTSVIQKNNIKSYLKMIKEQLSNEHNKTNQGLYSILIEKELDLMYSQKTDRALLKNKKDSI